MPVMVNLHFEVALIKKYLGLIKHTCSGCVCTGISREH